MFIGWRICASQAELSRDLELSPKTIKKHLKQLVELGLIERTRIENGVMYTSHKKPKIVERGQSGREVIYRLTMLKDKNIHMGALLGELLSTYEKGLVNDDITQNILYICHFFSPGFKKRTKIKSNEAHYKYMEKLFFDIFPHPYYG